MAAFPLRLRVVSRSLWRHRRQSALMVFAIALGVFCLGLLLRTRFLAEVSLSEAYAASRPPSLLIRTAQPFDDATITHVAQIPGVAHAEGRVVALLHISYGDEVWRPLQLIARADYLHQQVDLISPVTGQWPPAHGLLLEQSAAAVTGAGVGDEVMVRNQRGERMPLIVEGSVRTLSALPSTFSGGRITAVTSRTRAEQLVGSVGFNEVMIATAPGLSVSQLASLRISVVSALKAQGVEVLRISNQNPATHPSWRILQPALDVLTALPVLALLISVLLTAGAVRTIMAREMPQIGVLKTLGFNSRQIVALYLAGVGLLGLCALALAAPAATVGARLLAQRLTDELYINVSHAWPPAWLIAVEAAAALLVALLAAMIPLSLAGRTPVTTLLRTGPATYAHFGSFWPERLGLRSGWPARFGYPLRNLLRHKLRLLLTLAVLAFSGAATIAVISLWLGVGQAVRQAQGYWAEDLLLSLPQPLGVTLMRQELRSLAGVAAVEARLVREARWTQAARPDAWHDLTVIGVPEPTVLRPTLLAGRWPGPTESDAIVINAHGLRDVPDLSVGADLVLEVGDRQRRLRVTGIAGSQLLVAKGVFMPVAYLPYRGLSEWLGVGGKANLFAISTEQRSPAFVNTTALQIDNHLYDYGLYQFNLMVAEELRAAMTRALGAIDGLCAVLVMLFALSSALTMSSLLSISVLERTRELGVLRALGADGRQITGLVLRESLALGLGAWAIAVALSLPLSYALGDLVGRSILDAPLPGPYIGPGVLLWLVISLATALLAPLAPLRGALRLPVRAALSS